MSAISSSKARDALLKLLEAASLLAGTSKPSDPPRINDISDVLLRRLEAAQSHLGDDKDNADKAAVQRKTALYALNIVERVQALLDAPEKPFETTPMIGTRHLAHLKTLISIIFKWVIEPELLRLWSQAVHIPTDPQIIEISDSDDENEELAALCVRIFSLIFRREPLESSVPSTSAQGASQSSIPQTHITQALLSRHVTDVLRPTIYLGWIDRDSHSFDRSTLDNLNYTRACVIRLLNFLPSSQTISSLGAIMTPTTALPTPPSSLKKACSSMLSRQLLRPDGVRGLFSAIFGEEDGVEDAPLAKLEHVSRILNTAPSHISRQEYVQTLVPRLVSIITPLKTPSSDSSPEVPNSHIRAASFTISRFLNSPTTGQFARLVLLPPLHSSFHPQEPISEHTSLSENSLSQSLNVLTILLLNTDPSPALISTLLSPIIAPVYALVEFLENRRGAVLSDPSIKELANGLLKTWARVGTGPDVTNGWWGIIRGDDGWGLWNMEDSTETRKEWVIRSGDPVVTNQRPSKESIPSFEALTGTVESSNPLQMRPDPVQLVKTLKMVDRKEVSGALFVRALDEYGFLRQAPDVIDPLRVMLHLNIVLEMVEQLGSKVLTETYHILAFIAHALQPPSSERPPSSALAPPQSEHSVGLKFEDLRIVQDGDSDDDDEPETGAGGPGGSVDKDDMTFTAVNLLLFILEADPDLTPASTPILQVIFHHLEPLTNSASNSVRRPALEARLVITTRSAASTASSSSMKESAPSDHEVYQEALKLVQDSILPVRAHGLLMLRHLVVPPPKSAKGGDNRRKSDPPPPLDPALIPAILDVFIQSVQDDDSFVFLNAVQGLAAMVDRLGRDILRRLVDIYAKGIDAPLDMRKHEMDKRLRVGEALGQVVRRCGDALAVYVDVMVPSLTRTFRSSFAPTNLRSSALSILALCADTSPLSILPWSEDLSEGVVDLLLIESVPFKLVSKTNTKEFHASRSEDELHENADRDSKKPEIKDALAYEDSIPALSTSSKVPTFRRAALHFLALLLRAGLARLYNESVLESHSIRNFESFDRSLNGRLGTVIRYVKATDQDGIVRAQAAECVELFEQLERARMGL